MLKIGQHYYVRTTITVFREKALHGGVASSIKYYMLSKKSIDYTVAVKSFNIISGKPIFLYSPYEAINVTGSFEVAPINISKIPQRLL
ncbi:coenzyme F420 hydrogenase/dehydrogenase beta subunit N-terminal domain-containing protein [Staphylothermus hellenicus]|uniref:Coenzyme F420 hydrogenase/dehydrogenase beta subunit N-terminal domain-containing protein n=1 Tax=Staphylothermus hellenicus (strain DSM 12710 / JCM 10830 / BK20S6-10-b1 / P8) TaxID=591019 RepID=D7DCE4_STAHD|nr:coenzyme F420 hydrogenase/dehydrogenase beta subunit N-terminal domain-containing protein [Staphylothermus hellenicus]ADI31841.1 hypothetical protein Shell_0722 [Staphylothermus hellenicus DSM 12710]